MSEGTALVPVDQIERAILLIRGQKVLLDEDLAELYGVETKNLVRAVKRNLDRFPEDFMFPLTPEEYESLRCQNGTSKTPGRGGRRYLPYAFTEQGVAMLSSVLRSPRAVQVNIEIMRAFVRLRQFLASHEELARKVADMDQQLQRGGDGKTGRRGAMVIASLSPCLVTAVVWTLFAPDTENEAGPDGPSRSAVIEGRRSPPGSGFIFRPIFLVTPLDEGGKMW